MKESSFGPAVLDSLPPGSNGGKGGSAMLSKHFQLGLRAQSRYCPKGTLFQPRHVFLYLHPDYLSASLTEESQGITDKDMEKGACLA